MATESATGTIECPTIEDKAYELLTTNSGSDTILAYASLPNHVSFRDEHNGIYLTLPYVIEKSLSLHHCYSRS